MNGLKRRMSGLARALALRRAARVVQPHSRSFSSLPEGPQAARKEDRIATLPNALSLVRLVALAPLAGLLIVRCDYASAAGVVAAAGALDALDGAIARRFDQASTLGSYLDPAADKALLVTCALALGAQGVLPGWLAALMAARDAALVAGSLALRAATLPPGQRFFALAPLRAPPQPQPPQSKLKPSAADGASVADAWASGAAAGPASAARGTVWGAEGVRPSLLSKVNTALQIALVCAGLGAAAWSLPPPPRADAAAALRWRWRGGEAERPAPIAEGSGPDASAIAASPAAAVIESAPSGPSDLALPALVVATAATTFASGSDYLVRSVRFLAALRRGRT